MRRLGCFARVLFVPCFLAQACLLLAADIPQMPNVSLNVATLCDSASDSDGKLSIRGAFDTISAKKFPAEDRCALALRLTFTQEEFKKQHSVTVRFVDDKGESFFDEVRATLKKADTDAPLITANLIVDFAALKFRRPGIHFVQISLNGALLTTLHVHARLLPGKAVA